MTATVSNLIRNPKSLTYAERRKNNAQHIVRGGCAGDRVERTQGVVKIEQQHFVGKSLVSRLARAGQCFERFLDELLVAQIGNELSFRRQIPRRRCDLKQGGLQFWYAFASQRRGPDSRSSGFGAQASSGVVHPLRPRL